MSFQKAPINYGNVVSGSDATPASVAGTYFYSRITGYLVPAVTGLYTIGVNCADGCNLFIGNQPIVANLAGADTASSTLGYTRSGTIMLTKGVYYPITLEWQHGSGANFQLQLIWTPPLGSPALIPAANLTRLSSSVTADLAVSFWNGTSGLWYPGGNGTIDFTNAAHPGIATIATATDLSTVSAAVSVVSAAVSTETARATAAEAALGAVMTPTVGGLVPTPPNDATKFLDGTGHFTSPAGGGGGGGDLVKIGEVILGADGPTISFASIPGTYRNLKLLLTGRSDDSTPDVYMQYNGDTGTNYDYAGGYHGSGNGDLTGFGVAKAIVANIAPSTAPAGCAGVSEITIFDYARTVWNKAARSITHRLDGAGSGYVLMWGMTWLSTAAINAIVIGKQSGAGNFKAGTVATLYGMN